MKRILLGFLTLALSTSAMAITFENVTGEYEVTYKTGLIFSKEESFQVRFLPLERGEYGDVEFESADLGFCDNKNPQYDGVKYGYGVMNVDDPLSKIDHAENVSHIQSTVFCDSGFYMLSIEVKRGELEQTRIGESINAGFYLRNSDNRDVLDKKATITRLN